MTINERSLMPGDLQGGLELMTNCRRLRCQHPRVRVVKTGTGQVIEPAIDETENLDDFHARFLAACGTTNRTIAEAVLEQLLNVLAAGKPIGRQESAPAIGCGRSPSIY